MVTCLASSGLVLSVSLLLDSVFTSRFTENGHLKVSAGTSVFLSYGSVFAVVSLLTDSTTCDKAKPTPGETPESSSSKIADHPAPLVFPELPTGVSCAASLISS